MKLKDFKAFAWRKIGDYFFSRRVRNGVYCVMIRIDLDPALRAGSQVRIVQANGGPNPPQIFTLIPPPPATNHYVIELELTDCLGDTVMVGDLQVREQVPADLADLCYP